MSIDPASSVSTTTPSSSPGDSSVSMATISMATLSIVMLLQHILFGGVAVPLGVPPVPLEVPLRFGVESVVVSSSLIISSSFPSSSSSRYIGIS